ATHQPVSQRYALNPLTVLQTAEMDAYTVETFPSSSNSGNPPPPQHTARLLTPAQVFPIASHSPSHPKTNIVLRQRTLGSFHRLLTSHRAQ
ncbi:hypothetical protein KUCAC02_026026, partial [Chaenocephalus aceratus]